MKPIILFLLAGTIGLFLACNKEDPILPDPSMSAVYDMVCKYQDSIKGEELEKNQTCVFWEYDGDSTLTLTHYNAGFNCCPVAILTSMIISGDTVYVTERDSLQLCRCNCLYDLDFVVHHLKPQKYIVKFIERYVIEPNPPLVFEIDLEEDLSGEVYQDRDYNPWGNW